jgi:hypothetical protein
MRSDIAPGSPPQGCARHGMRAISRPSMAGPGVLERRTPSDSSPSGGAPRASGVQGGWKRAVGGQRHVVDVGLRARDRVVVEARES